MRCRVTFAKLSLNCSRFSSVPKAVAGVWVGIICTARRSKPCRLWCFLGLHFLEPSPTGFCLPSLLLLRQHLRLIRFGCLLWCQTQQRSAVASSHPHPAPRCLPQPQAKLGLFKGCSRGLPRLIAKQRSVMETILYDPGP